jgi:uncharacterized membrane protein
METAMISAPSFIARIVSPSLLIVPFMAAGLVASTPPPAFAQAASAAQAEAPKGLWLTTAYPEFSAQAGETIKLDLSLANSGLPPQRVDLKVDGLPDGWHWEIDGGGRAVGAAIAQTDKTVDLSLNLTPPDGAKKGTYPFEITGEAGGAQLKLPVSLTLRESEPAKLTLKADLPALRGTPKSSFDFQVTAKNDGQEDTTVNLLSKAPAGFQVAFKESYGTQELTSLPLEAGKSKTLKVSVQPPDGVEAGQYPVAIAATGGDATAELQLALDITGQPKLALSGPGGRLSGQATAGEKRSFTFTVENTGTAPAREIGFSASPPQGWEVKFDPEKIPEVAPGQTADVSVSMTPSDKAIAGDYVVSVRANGDGASDSASFRVTVETSTLWGVTGLGVIAAAVVVLGFGVSRYGRR